MMEKRGDLNEKTSKSDFDSSKKVAFYDEDGFEVADALHKNKLNNPVPVDCFPCKQTISTKKS